MSEQRCFEIMNMNDKTFIFSPDAPSGFFSEFSAEKIFSNFFSPEFSAEKIFEKKFFQIFFSPEFSAEKIFFKIFFNFFPQNFFTRFFPHHSAEPKN